MRRQTHQENYIHTIDTTARLKSRQRYYLTSQSATQHFGSIPFLLSLPSPKIASRSTSASMQSYLQPNARHTLIGRSSNQPAAIPHQIQTENGTVMHDLVDHTRFGSKNHLPFRKRMRCTRYKGISTFLWLLAYMHPTIVDVIV